MKTGLPYNAWVELAKLVIETIFRLLDDKKAKKPKPKRPTATQTTQPDRTK